MPAFDPLAAVGTVLREEADGVSTFLGSCFAFRYDGMVVTARHCIDPDISKLRFRFPRTGTTYAAHEVHPHPKADIAIVLGEDRGALEARRGYPQHAFWDFVRNFGLAEEVLAYGFPAEGPTFDSASTPEPRLFVSHYQRFFYYSGSSGYSYDAGELSVPAPGGLSGGPVFRRGAPQMLTGMVAANAESYAISDSIALVEKDGTRYKEESRRILSYGISLLLCEIATWLNSVSPVPVDRTWME